MYTIKLDDDRYIMSISHTVNDDVDIDLSLLEVKYLNAYRYINSEIFLDEVKKAEMIAAETKEEEEAEVADLKKKLADSDYIFAEELEAITSLSNPVTFITDFIKIIVEYATKYKDLIADRKSWRQRIEELEG